MKTIVETLEAQHRAIEHEVATLNNALAMESLGGARVGLDRLETMLLSHIKLENTDFYPELLARAEGDATHHTVSLFQQNLARIGEGLLTFFTRWKGPLTPLRLQALRPEWAASLKLLSGRLRDEDKVLHPIHRKLFSH